MPLIKSLWIKLYLNNDYYINIQIDESNPESNKFAELLKKK